MEGCHRLDFRGLQLAHIVHRGIGGRNGAAEVIINDPRNIAHICAYWHDLIDGRQRGAPGEKAEVITALKLKINWYEWALESRAKGINIGRIE